LLRFSGFSIATRAKVSGISPAAWLSAMEQIKSNPLGKIAHGSP
jgi:hypothetical protein